ncbi:MAG: helix-turn-helix domain-containing protein [Candidatus Omnitrophica bacterium]|nr:helix-turn-helix domain-containing protein [Candidatus Omnitrophota bacterium]MBU4467949.1 helix-turn-helix domain-containing protein [Candidatus Omnitrophota bacterium]
MDITEEWVRDLIARKEVKAVKVGKWRIKPEDLEIFIKSRSNL